MPDQLIEELVRDDREITESELQDLRLSVAAAGFDQTATTRAGSELAGLIWQGRILESHERIPNEVRHYLRHVVAGEEWPSNTSRAEYIESLQHAILDDEGAVMLEMFPGLHRLTILGRSGRWRGPSGGPHILVGYNLGYGYWVTGFQPREERLLSIQAPEGVSRRWLQRLK